MKILSVLIVAALVSNACQAELSQGELVRAKSDNKYSVFDFIKNEEFVVSGGNETALYSVSDCKVKKKIQGQFAAIRGLHITGAFLAIDYSENKFGNLIHYDISKDKTLVLLKGANTIHDFIAKSTDETKIALYEEVVIKVASISIFDPNFFRIEAKYKPFPELPTDLVFSHDAGKIGITGIGGIGLIDTADGELHFYSKVKRTIAFVPDTNHFASIPKRAPYLEVSNYSSSAFVKKVSCSFKPDRAIIKFISKAFFIVNTDGNKIDLLNANTGEVVKRFVGHDKDINKIVISPNGRLFLTSSDDGEVKLWKIPEEIKIDE